MNRNNDHIGFVTQFSLDRLVGFLFPLSSTSPRLVQLYINGELHSEQIASQKSNVLVRNKLSPNFQFSFDLRMMQTVYWSDDISVQTDGRELAWTHQLLLGLYNKGIKPQQFSSSKLFFFLHVPKTAGTSFRMMLYNHFKQHEIWPNIKDLERNRKRYLPVDELRAMSYERKSELRMVMGHYKIAVTREFIEKPIIISFWRRPVDHMISLASHKQRQKANLAKMSLAEVMQNHIVDNAQTRFLLPPHTHDMEITNDLFKLALRNLDLIEFVGVQDQFNEGLNYLEAKYKWSLGKRLKKNVGGKQNQSAELLSVIQKRTSWDEKLYQAATTKFNELLSQLN